MRIFKPLTLPLAALAILLASTVHAGPIAISLSLISDVAAGATGQSFDVLLANTGPTDVSIAAFFFEVTSSSSDITFTDATTATGNSYIFGANSLFGPDIIGGGSTATDLNASDIDSAGSAIAPSLFTIGLGHVFFDVAPGAATQLVTFSVVGFPGTSLSDAQLNDIPIDTLRGQDFMINGQAPAVPEPGSVVLFGAGLAALAGLRRVRIRR